MDVAVEVERREEPTGEPEHLRRIGSADTGGVLGDDHAGERISVGVEVRQVRCRRGRRHDVVEPRRARRARDVATEVEHRADPTRRHGGRASWCASWSSWSWSWSSQAASSWSWSCVGGCVVRGRASWSEACVVVVVDGGLVVVVVVVAGACVVVVVRRGGGLRRGGPRRAPRACRRGGSARRGRWRRAAWPEPRRGRGSAAGSSAMRGPDVLVGTWRWIDRNSARRPARTRRRLRTRMSRVCAARDSRRSIRTVRSHCRCRGRRSSRREHRDHRDRRRRSTSARPPPCPAWSHHRRRCGDDADGAHDDARSRCHNGRRDTGRTRRRRSTDGCGTVEPAAFRRPRRLPPDWSDDEPACTTPLGSKQRELGEPRERPGHQSEPTERHVQEAPHHDRIELRSRSRPPVRPEPLRRTSASCTSAPTSSRRRNRRRSRHGQRTRCRYPTDPGGSRCRRSARDAPTPPGRIRPASRRAERPGPRPSSGCDLIVSYSSAVSLPGLFEDLRSRSPSCRRRGAGPPNGACPVRTR